MSASPYIADCPARILIVDDESDNRELLAVILTWEGFVVVTAASGEEALATVAQQAPDLILLDVMMPGMNGYEVVAKIKGDVATKNIPVLMVSAVTDRNARMRGLSAGAEDFLAKPVERAELVRRGKEPLAPEPEERRRARCRKLSGRFTHHARVRVRIITHISARHWCREWRPRGSIPMQTDATDSQGRGKRRSCIPRGPMSLSAPAPDAERSVLIVDDDHDLLTQLAGCLSAAGFSVAQASDGIDALSYLYATRPRAVLIDLMMPRMNGVELIEQIRSDPSFDGVDVVAMSGMPTMLARAQKAGADKILCKPLEPMVLVRALSRSQRTGVSSSPGAPVSPRDKEPQRSA